MSFKPLVLQYSINVLHVGIVMNNKYREDTYLTGTYNTVLYNRLLEKSLNNSEGIRIQDALTVWNNMPRTAISSRVAFSYIRNSWSSLFER
jgi:CRISPR/Cas system-associated endonuclease Cas3-HD